MAYYHVDVPRARLLVRQLRAAARLADPAYQLVVIAEARSQIACGAGPLLDQARSDLLASAAAIDRAVNELLGFRMELPGTSSTIRADQPGPSRTPVPHPHDPAEWRAPTSSSEPRWNVRPTVPWSAVRQDASHNSYAVTNGIDALFSKGFRTFELDIHRGAPTNFTPPVTPGRDPIASIITDHLDHRGGRADDWRVYHVSGSAHSEYDYLSTGLAAVAALPTTDPLTVFIDNKDALAGSHTSAAFDQVVTAAFGDRLFTPSQLHQRAPAAANLSDAVAVAGWPTAAELQGRVIVVMTDQVAAYTGVTAFSATAPVTESTPTGFVHLAEPDVVIYNADARSISPSQVVAVQHNNNLIRTYFNPPCRRMMEGADPAVGAPNYRAIDLDDSADPCAPPVPRPPEGTPVPVVRD